MRAREAAESWKVTEAVVELGEAGARQLQMASRDSLRKYHSVPFGAREQKSGTSDEGQGACCVVCVELATPE